MVAEMNGLICGGRLEATQTDVSTLLQTLSRTQTVFALNADKFENTFCVSNRVLFARAFRSPCRNARTIDINVLMSSLYFLSVCCVFCLFVPHLEQRSVEGMDGFDNNKSSKLNNKMQAGRHHLSVSCRKV